MTKLIEITARSLDTRGGYFFFREPNIATTIAVITLISINRKLPKLNISIKVSYVIFNLLTPFLPGEENRLYLLAALYMLTIYEPLKKVNVHRESG
jgi:hypothetical protein